MSASYAKAGADATNNFIETYAKGRVERAQMKATEAENERMNKATWTAMGNRINTANMQRGILRQQTGTDLLNIQKESARAGSASINNAAAAGIVGASVSDAINDINRQQQEATANTKTSEEIQEINLDTQVEDIIQGAYNAQRYSQKPTSEGEIIGRAIGTSSMTFISSLAGSSFDYTPTSGDKWSTSEGNGASGGSYNAEEATNPKTNTGQASQDFSTDYSNWTNSDSSSSDASGRFVNGWSTDMSQFNFFGN